MIELSNQQVTATIAAIEEEGLTPALCTKFLNVSIFIGMGDNTHTVCVGLCL